MEKAIQVKIVSPERTLFHGQAKSILVPGQKGSFELSKNESGEYDVSLICPHPEAGIWYDDYYTNRTLSFDFVTGGDDSTYYNPNDYMVL